MTLAVGHQEATSGHIISQASVEKTFDISTHAKTKNTEEKIKKKIVSNVSFLGSHWKTGPHQNESIHARIKQMLSRVQGIRSEMMIKGKTRITLTSQTKKTTIPDASGGGWRGGGGRHVIYGSFHFFA